MQGDEQWRSPEVAAGEEDAVAAQRTAGRRDREVAAAAEPVATAAGEDGEEAEAVGGTERRGRVRRDIAVTVFRRARVCDGSIYRPD